MNEDGIESLTPQMRDDARVGDQSLDGAEPLRAAFQEDGSVTGEQGPIPCHGHPKIAIEFANQACVVPVEDREIQSLVRRKSLKQRTLVLNRVRGDSREAVFEAGQWPL